MKAKHYAERAKKYAQKVIDGKIILGADAVNACKRFLKDLKRKNLSPGRFICGNFRRSQIRRIRQNLFQGAYQSDVKHNSLLAKLLK